MGLLSQAARSLFSKAPEIARLQEYRPNQAPKKEHAIQFQYWPESITDSKSPSYDRRFAPGGSHPIIQFQNGGDREISFSVMFTFEKNPSSSGVGGAVGDLLTGNFNIGVTASGERKDTNKEALETVMRKLRYFTYPTIENSIIKAPPMCLLILPNSGIQTVMSANQKSTTFKDSFVGVMTQCNITYQAWHRTGEPRLAEVQLSFLETIQVGTGWSYVGNGDLVPDADWGVKTASNNNPFSKLFA